MRGIALVGSDTGVGKTTVACALLSLARRRGLRLVPYKPVETGCDGRPPADATRLLAAAALPDLTLAQVCPFPFDPPLAPSRAALLDRHPLDPETLVAHARRLATAGDALLLETAGGLLSPYAPQFTGADLVQRLDLDVLLVVPNRLGAINQCALALSDLRHRSVQHLSVVLVDTLPADEDPSRRYNAADIAALTGVSPIGPLPHVPEPFGRAPAQDNERLAEAFAASGLGSVLDHFLPAPRRP